MCTENIEKKALNEEDLENVSGGLRMPWEQTGTGHSNELPNGINDTESNCGVSPNPLFPK